MSFQNTAGLRNRHRAAMMGEQTIAENDSDEDYSNGRHDIAQSQSNDNSQLTAPNIMDASPQPPPTSFNIHSTNPQKAMFTQDSSTGRILTRIYFLFLRLEQKSFRFKRNQINGKSSRSPATIAGFFSLLLLTMSNYMLAPMRDAAALKVGVNYIPILTLVSTILALASSVPVGWLFEAPNPERKWPPWRVKLGFTRGETQGTSLALFLRCFAICLFGYAISFKLMDLLGFGGEEDDDAQLTDADGVLVIWEQIQRILIFNEGESILGYAMKIASFVMEKFGKAFYVMFFLVVHLMKLHSISLMWGVTSEAMEYEEQAEIREKKRQRLLTSHGLKNQNEVDDENKKGTGGKSRARLKRLAFVGFGGTLGGIAGSVFVSMTAHKLHLSGLLIVAAILLLLSAELSIEMGQIMLRHWQEEQTYSSQEDLTLLDVNPSTVSDRHSESSESTLNASASSDNQEEVDSSMKRITSFGSGMKRIASGMSMASINSAAEVDSSMKKVTSVGSMKRIASGSSINSIRRAMSSGNNLSNLGNKQSDPINTAIHVGQEQTANHETKQNGLPLEEIEDETTFKKRLLRGVTTILKSRLLMTIFTYNALYATTNVLLSFQRAQLVANRSSNNSMDSDTAFLANINIASSVATFALQASGLGAYVANSFGLRGTLSLIPLVRLFGVSVLALWHVKADGEPPNLVLFLILDELTKVINFAVAKPVRENLWRGLSNEARYEAKPIVDALANRWGGGSAAFLIALLDRIMMYTGIGRTLEDGSKSLFGFPPLLILCCGSAIWWSVVSADLGQIRHRIDMELKKNE